MRCGSFRNIIRFSWKFITELKLDGANGADLAENRVFFMALLTRERINSLSVCLSLGEIRVKLVFGCHPKQIRNHYVTLYTCERAWDFNFNSCGLQMWQQCAQWAQYIVYMFTIHCRATSATCIHMSSGWLHLLSVLLRSLLFHQENKLNGAGLTKSSSDEEWQLFMRANDADTRTRRRRTKKRWINTVNDNRPPWCEQSKRGRGIRVWVCKRRDAHRLNDFSLAKTNLFLLVGQLWLLFLCKINVHFVQKYRIIYYFNVFCMHISLFPVGRAFIFILAIAKPHGTNVNSRCSVRFRSVNITCAMYVRRTPLCRDPRHTKCMSKYFEIINGTKD